MALSCIVVLHLPEPLAGLAINVRFGERKLAQFNIILSFCNSQTKRRCQRQLIFSTQISVMPASFLNSARSHAR